MGTRLFLQAALVLVSLGSVVACGGDSDGGGGGGGKKDASGVGGAKGGTGGSTGGIGNQSGSGGVTGGTGGGVGGSTGGTGGTISTGGVAGSGGVGGSAGSAGSGGIAGSAGAAGAAGAGDAGVDADASEPDADAGDWDAADVDVPPFCQPNEYRCSGDTLEVCNVAQTAFEFVHACGAGLCSEPSKKCLECTIPTQCATPSDPCYIATCVDNVCGTTPASVGTPCGTNGVCNGAGLCGTCLPGTSQCNGNATEICSSQGQWTAGTTCAFVCQSGQCTGVCVPGSKQCSSTTPQICDTTGQWSSQTTCSGSTPACHDGVCEPSTPASCSALAGTCGPNGNGYCCASKLVEGGLFSRSYDAVNYTDPSYTAAVSDFRLDAYEVTVGRFRQFVNAGKGIQSSPPAANSGAHPSIPSSGWSSSWNGNLAGTTAAFKTNLACNPTYATWTDTQGTNETRPINCVSWFDAFAFCVWDSARLPTEAEWNYAAAGGDEQRVYPWSIPPTSSYADGTFVSYYDFVDQCVGDGVPGCSIADLVLVGSKSPGRGRYGHYELSGNVWEWVLDTYTNPYAINPCTDCGILSGSSGRVVRGGSFFANPASIAASTRNFATANQRFFSTGLRCARPK